MIALAIDPGNEHSAFVLYQDERLLRHGKLDNDELLALVGHLRLELARDEAYLAIEMIASYGMPVGREVFETCVWIGRFVQAWDGAHAFVYRRDVKIHLCNSMRAKDPNVRQALLDRWGGRETAVGKKSSPGPLYGVSSDVWSALAVAVTFADKYAAETMAVVS